MYMARVEIETDLDDQIALDTYEQKHLGFFNGWLMDFTETTAIFRLSKETYEDAATAMFKLAKEFREKEWNVVSNIIQNPLTSKRSVAN